VLIRIDPQSPEPIFEQIVYQVKGLVARGELGQGDKLPSVRELAKEVSINPNTVIRAYDALERDGVLVRRQGAGCFLTGKKSALSEEEREKKLEDLMKRVVTEAFHLGFEPARLREALEEGLDGLQFSGEGIKRHELTH
jgi:GntR family transcriptional regulator